MQDTMYTLGMICRAIWPGKGQDMDSPPSHILDTVTTQPATGLAIMLKHPANTAAKQEAITELVDKLPADLKDPKSGVAAEDQGRFWIGYYHFAAALDHAKDYGPAELDRAGKALYGDRWQSDLARDLGVDSRRVRQWLTGDRRIPVGIWADICGLLRHRQMSIKNVLSSLDKG